MKILTLDMSKACTGWCVWHDDWAMAKVGSKKLGGEYSTNGDVFVALHRLIHDLRMTFGFELLFWEQKLAVQKIMTGTTSQQTLDLQGGLDAYAEGYRAAYRLRGGPVKVDLWRGEFIGKDVDGTIKAATRRHNRIAKEGGGKKITSTDKLKAATMERARQLGFKPANFDEADAIGIMDYKIQTYSITPPWRANEVLRPMSEIG
jgi:hypothetical protein